MKTFVRPSLVTTLLVGLLPACSGAEDGEPVNPGEAMPGITTTDMGTPLAPSVGEPDTDPALAPSASPPAIAPGASTPVDGPAVPPTGTDPVPVAVPGEEPADDVPTPVGPGETPMDPPTDAPPVVPSDIQFSVPSGTFEGQLSVAITGPAGAEVRYTTDGSLPTATSTVFDGTALVLTETTQLRAQGFAAGVASGLPKTAIYVARTFDAESDIPIIIMEGYAGGRPQKETAGFGAGASDEPLEQQELIDLGFMVFEPVAGVARISDPPVLATRAGYKERGQSSASAEKSPYKVEFWDENNDDLDLPVLGMPAESDWAMIGEAFDPTQLQNSLVYDWGAKMGLATVRLRFAELYINFDGGPLEETDYFGLYALTETIKNQKNRLDLKQLDESITTMPEITGGYIFKFDQAALDAGETELMCTGSEPLSRGVDEDATCWNDLGMVDPEVLNPEQLAYLEPHIQAFHDVLHETPIGDYAAYIDVPSFVDHTIINEITRDVDAYVRSSFFHKEREGLIKAGPLWDYNLAMTSYDGGTEGWHFESQLTSRGNDDWFYKLGTDPAFMAQFATRWTELRQSFLSDAAIAERIDELAAPIANAALRNQERWGADAEGGGMQGGGFGGFGGPIGDWQEAVAELKAWLPARMAWIDSAVAGL